MTITILQPTVGLPCGPGFEIKLSSDIIGPFPAGTEWNVYLEGGPTGEEILMIQPHGWSSPQVTLILGTNDNDTTRRPRVLPQAGQGTNGFIRATLRTSDGITQDTSERMPIELDFTTGIQPQLRVGATAGLTPVQDVALMQLQATLIPWFFWQLAGEVLPELAEALAGRLRTKPTRIQYNGPLSGLVDIPPPTTGVFTKWVGLEWAVVGAPPGLGLDFGSPDSTEINWGQISRRRAVADGTETIDSTWYESRTTASQYWGLEEPSSVQVYILPGVLTQFWYLVQLEPIVVAASSSAPTTSADS